MAALHVVWLRLESLPFPTRFPDKLCTCLPLFMPPQALPKAKGAFQRGCVDRFSILSETGGCQWPSAEASWARALNCRLLRSLCKPCTVTGFVLPM